MRYLLSGFLVVLVLSATTFAQTRQQALDNLSKLKDEAIRLEAIILSPDKQDIDLAEKEKVNVFRILPREFDRKSEIGKLFSIRGGGAYYSFSKQSHSYNETPQIQLEQNYLSFGFYGCSNGIMVDFGETSLFDIGEKNKGFNYLIDYQPSTTIEQCSTEHYRISGGFEIEGISFKNRFPVKVGNTYLLRAISYDEADVFVALKVQRKDDDGSLIIFWKLIKQFDKPILIR